MHKAVEQGGGHDLVAEELGPGFEALVARDDNRTLVKIRDKSEEEVPFVALYLFFKSAAC